MSPPPVTADNVEQLASAPFRNHQRLKDADDDDQAVKLAHRGPTRSASPDPCAARRGSAAGPPSSNRSRSAADGRISVPTRFPLVDIARRLDRVLDELTGQATSVMIGCSQISTSRPRSKPDTVPVAICTYSVA